MGGSRECRCTCDGFALVLRVLSFLAHASTGAAGGYGFVLAGNRWTKEKVPLSGDVGESLVGLNRSLAVFQGLMATYYWWVARRSAPNFIGLYFVLEAAVCRLNCCPRGGAAMDLWRTLNREVTSHAFGCLQAAGK